MKKRQYNIAVMLPTHKRTDALSRSIFSLINLASDLTRIQFILGVDNNDPIGQEHFINAIQPEFDRLDINYEVLEFEPLGYTGLNVYYNTLATRADADWLMVWCDDAIMSTQGWDDRISECTGEFKLLKVHTHNEHPYSIFPILPAEWVELRGCYSKHQLIDSENSHIAYYLDVMKIIEVAVTHDRADLTGNNKDETSSAKSKIVLEGNPNDPRDFHHNTFQTIRLESADQLSQYMKTKNLDTTWWENCKAGKQDPWVKMRENDPNNQTHAFSMIKNFRGKLQLVRNDSV